MKVYPIKVGEFKKKKKKKKKSTKPPNLYKKKKKKKIDNTPRLIYEKEISMIVRPSRKNHDWVLLLS